MIEIVNESGRWPDRVVTTLDERPDLVTVAYNLLTNGLPQATTFARGPYTDQIHYWITKQSPSGNKEHQITVQNQSSIELYVHVAAYARNG